MAEIKRILKLAEENIDLSERQLAKAVGCSKNTIKVIKARVFSDKYTQSS